MRVLVVDDQYTGRMVARALLEDLGFAADAAESGEAALSILAERTYDAVLLDCQMPGLDGFETCRRLRRHEGDGRHTLVIAVTAGARAEDRQRCLEAGMDDYLAKPLRSAELAAALDGRLGTAAPEGAPGGLAGERLAALRRLGGESFQAEVVRAFLQQGEDGLEIMRNALPARDFEAIAAAAHALSGSAGILGGGALAETAGELAALARQGDLGACAERLPALEREIRAFAREIGA